MNIVKYKNSDTPLVNIANMKGVDGIEIEVRRECPDNELDQVTSGEGDTAAAASATAAAASAAAASASSEAAPKKGNQPADDSSSLTVGQKRRLYLRRRMNAEEQIRDYNRRLALIAVIFVVLAVDMALFLRIAPPLKIRLRRTLAASKSCANQETVTATMTPPNASTGSTPTHTMTDRANAILREYQNFHESLQEKAIKEALDNDDEFLPLYVKLNVSDASLCMKGHVRPSVRPYVPILSRCNYQY